MYKKKYKKSSPKLQKDGKLQNQDLAPYVYFQDLGYFYSFTPAQKFLFVFSQTYK